MKQKIRKTCETRERLLDTALGLISKSSYSNVGVMEICGCAGVTKGSFYHFFESKSALYDAACDHYWEEKKRDLDAIFSPEHDSLARLEGWIDYILDMQQRKDEGDPVAGCPIFVSSAQCGEEDDSVRQAGIRIAEKSMKYSVALVRGLQADGHLQGDTTPEQTGRMLLHYVQGLILYAQVMQDCCVATEDLRGGVYKLIALKPELWRTGDASKPVAGLEQSSASTTLLQDA